MRKNINITIVILVSNSYLDRAATAALFIPDAIIRNFHSKYGYSDSLSLKLKYLGFFKR
jgi:hypothetical protein